MAKIKWGMMVVDGRGKLGGHVLSKNKSGAIVRTKVTPSNPQTTFQQAVRAILATISQGWSALTQPQIDAWNGQAPQWQKTNEFGDLVAPSGKALYQSLNQNLLLTGQATIDVPPAKQELPSEILEVATFDLTNEFLSLSGIHNVAGYVMVIEATPPVSQGTTNVKNRYRKIAEANTGGYTPADGWDGYVAKFGTPLAGQKIFVRVKYVADNGQASIPSSVQATITP